MRGSRERTVWMAERTMKGSTPMATRGRNCMARR